MNKTVTAIVIVAVLAAGIFIGYYYYAYKIQPVQPVGGTVHNVLEDFNSGIAVNGTTIIDKYGGFWVQPEITSYATGTVNAFYTNSTSADMMCSGGGVYADSLSTTLGRNFKFSMGTSTSATSGAGTNLIASTTVATTTDTFTQLAATYTFMLKKTQSVILYFSDVDANATSTYFKETYWKIYPAIGCTFVGK